MIAPKIGPKPAIFKNCTKKMRQGDIGTKSTPSVFVNAGVLRSGSMPKIFSTNVPYVKNPTTNKINATINVIISILISN